MGKTERSKWAGAHESTWATSEFQSFRSWTLSACHAVAWRRRVERFPFRLLSFILLNFYFSSVTARTRTNMVADATRDDDSFASATMFVLVRAVTEEK